MCVWMDVSGIVIIAPGCAGEDDSFFVRWVANDRHTAFCIFRRNFAGGGGNNLIGRCCIVFVNWFVVEQGRRCIVC